MVPHPRRKKKKGQRTEEPDDGRSDSSPEQVCRSLETGLLLRCRKVASGALGRWQRPPPRAAHAPQCAPRSCQSSLIRQVAAGTHVVVHLEGKPSRSRTRFPAATQRHPPFPDDRHLRVTACIMAALADVAHAPVAPIRTWKGSYEQRNPGVHPSRTCSGGRLTDVGIRYFLNIAMKVSLG